MRGFPKVFFIVLAIFTSDAEAQLFTIGACATVPPIANAVPALLARQWFVFSQTPSIHDITLKCTGALIAIPVVNTLTITLTTNKVLNRIVLTGTITPVGALNQGIFSVRLDGIKYSPTDKKPQVFTIFATDGVVVAGNVVTAPTFLAIYTCKSIGFLRLERGIILTTLRIPTAATIAAANAAFANQNLGLKNLKVTGQDAC